MATDTGINRPAPFVEDIGKNLAEQTVAQTQVPVVTTGLQGLGSMAQPTQQAFETAEQFKQRQDLFGAQQRAALGFEQRQQALSGLTQQVAGLDRLQTEAQKRAEAGLGSFQPFLTQAQQLSGAGAGTGPGSVQQFMSPYQQQVIDTTLAEFDKQAAAGIPGLQASAVAAGAFGGGREGVRLAEYQAQSDKNRAALQGQLLQQGFTQAQNLAQQDFARRQALTGLQQNLAQSQLGLGTTTGGLATSQLGLGEFSRGLASLQPSLEASTQQQLGTAGTGALSLRQALLDANQQRAQLAYQEPISRIQALGSGLASQVGGVPTTTQTLGTTQPVASPLSQALQVGLTAYGLGNIFGGN